MKGRREATTLVVFAVITLGLLGWTFAIGNKPLLGLDLKGGISATLQPLDKNVPSSSVEQAKEIIRNRIDALGVAEPDIVRQGKTVVISLPGVKDPEKAKEVIGRTAKMEFRAVMPAGTQATTGQWQAPNPFNAQVVAALKKQSTSTTTPRSSTSAAKGATTTTTTASTTGNSSSTTTPGTTAGSATSTSAAAGTQGRSVHVPATTTPPTTQPPASSSTTATTSGSTTTTTPTNPLVASAAKYGNPDVPQAVEACLASAPTDLSPTTGEVVLPGQIDHKQTYLDCYLMGPVNLQGEALSKSQPQLDNTGQWQVGVSVKTKFESKANRFMNACYDGNSDSSKGPICPITGQGDTGQRGRMAIVLDGQVISAPTVDALNLASNAGGFTITGNFSHSSANDLSLQLRYGALPVTFKEATFQKVSAKLGSDSLHAGLVSGLVGLALVAIYMLVFYRVLGLVAIASLGAASALLWVVIAYLGVHGGLALTLSGITGIIVSVGVAVDSNVVYFEHLREDTDKGRTLRGTVDRSFSDAWRVILSADLVSLIGAVILYYFTVGSVRGFAFYLGLSTILDLVASWFLMRPAVLLLARSAFFQDRPRMLGVSHRHHTDLADDGRVDDTTVAGAEA
ncbi:MAG TPA: protein translocase subunit SecD [Acidimicrobiales bacterium]|nr:protein translocase subunit SecD [Acidimicrobiales bacterium]